MHDENHRRLYWACRRGMLELDLMLIPFLEHCYEDLSLAEKASFEQFLTCIDPDLYSWLTNPCEVPADPNYAHLVKLIRHYAQTRHHSKAE